MAIIVLATLTGGAATIFLNWLLPGSVRLCIQALATSGALAALATAIARAGVRLISTVTGALITFATNNSVLRAGTMGLIGWAGRRRWAGTPVVVQASRLFRSVRAVVNGARNEYTQRIQNGLQNCGIELRNWALLTDADFLAVRAGIGNLFQSIRDVFLRIFQANVDGFNFDLEIGGNNSPDEIAHILIDMSRMRAGGGGTNPSSASDEPSSAASDKKLLTPIPFFDFTQPAGETESDSVAVSQAASSDDEENDLPSESDETLFETEANRLFPLGDIESEIIPSDEKEAEAAGAEAVEAPVPAAAGTETTETGAPIGSPIKYGGAIPRKKIKVLKIASARKILSQIDFKGKPMYPQ
jgi:hypothetical protein